MIMWKYNKGKQYGDITIKARFCDIHLATQQNINGKYSKSVRVFFIHYIRDYKGAALYLFGRVVWSGKQVGSI